MALSLMAWGRERSLMTIRNPAISISPTSLRTEGAAGTSGNAQFDVVLSNPSSQVITVSFGTANGTATAGSDYVATSGTITFNPGETSKSIPVQVSGDNIDEVDETYFVNLSNPTNATISRAQGVGTILDDDGPTFEYWYLPQSRRAILDLSTQCLL